MQNVAAGVSEQALAQSHSESPSVSTRRRQGAGGPAFGLSWQMMQGLQARSVPRLTRLTRKSTAWSMTSTAGGMVWEKGDRKKGTRKKGTCYFFRGNSGDRHFRPDLGPWGKRGHATFSDEISGDRHFRPDLGPWTRLRRRLRRVNFGPWTIFAPRPAFPPAASTAGLRLVA